MAGRAVAVRCYPGVEHAFNNDMLASRYNAEAVTLAFFKKALARTFS